MKKLSYIVLACLLCISAVCCKKKDDGINNNLDPKNQRPYDFMSTKNGSWWQYGTRGGNYYYRYARNKDTVKMGLTYSYYERKIDTSLGHDPEYFGKNEQRYLTLIDLDGKRTNYLNYVFYIDSAVLGTEWTNTGSVKSPIGSVGAKISSKVAEVGLSMNYGPHNFTDVIHVHSKLEAGTLNTDVGTVDIWFIKGIGVIREEANIDVLGQYSKKHTDSLVDYHLAP